MKIDTENTLVIYKISKISLRFLGKLSVLKNKKMLQNKLNGEGT